MLERARDRCGACLEAAAAQSSRVRDALELLGEERLHFEQGQLAGEVVRELPETLVRDMAQRILHIRPLDFGQAALAGKTQHRAAKVAVFQRQQHIDRRQAGSQDPDGGVTIDLAVLLDFPRGMQITRALLVPPSWEIPAEDDGAHETYRSPSATGRCQHDAIAEVVAVGYFVWC